MVRPDPVTETTQTPKQNRTEVRKRTATPTRAGQALVLASIVLLALNLRVAVASLGVVLPQVRADTEMSAVFAGVLTTVPVLSFAVFGASTGVLSGRIGLHRSAALGLLLIVAGLAARPFAHGRWLFLILTVVAVAGAAIGNVILPPLVRQHFPERIAAVSSLYGAALVGGATLASATTVPLASALGGWRPALGLWSLLALLAFLPWLGFSLRRRATSSDRSRPNGSSHRTVGWPLRRLARSRLAWMMALLFAAQSAQAYAQFGWYPAILVDGGLSAGRAALMLALITAVGVPMTLALPALIRLTRGRSLLPIGYGVITVFGWLGVLIAPATLPWLSAVLLGAGSTAFTWVLAMIAQHSRTPAGTVALSGFVQGVGYLIAALGPFGTGALHDLTGAWTVPILVLIVFGVLIGVLGAIVVRAGSVEDDLERSAPSEGAE